MKKTLFACAFAGVLLFSCEVEEETQNLELQTVNLSMKNMVAVDIAQLPPATPIAKLDLKTSNLQFAKANNTEQNEFSELQSRADALNALLIPYGVQLEKMEYYSADAAGRTVFFSDTGNKQLGSDFVPNDPRNAGGETVPYIIDGTQLTTASGLNTFGAIENVMNTWNEVTCSDGLELPNFGVSPTDIGFISNVFFGFGGSNGFFPGIIVQAGILPSDFFDLVAPGGGSFILGVTFTLTYIEDINEDGVGDVAIKEIYYNDAFNWQDTVATGGGVDFETVALHETGHALSQAHFGKVSITESNGKVHFSPRALMNAGYSGVNRVVEKTDKAGHCSNWGNWPNN
ncbi:hypothetical protein ACFSQJ_01700 [Croceitalea marina]|uniref:Peptidase M10 metallopeptidase domain-containing protein n=1 Tax=Croceitalea marina TaxID=1775166 RepID=A0ABW5MTW9_9FLAO